MSTAAPRDETSAAAADASTRERFRVELVGRRAGAEAVGDAEQVAKLDRMLARLDDGRPLYITGEPSAAPEPDAVVQGQREQVEQVRAAARGELPDGWTEGSAYVERRRRHSAG
jgi:hypothetical protein